MALTCGGSCMKMLLFVFNGLFFLGGVIMMAVGIWFLVDPEISERFDNIAVGTDNLFRGAAITMIIVGTLILVIAFFGCCGACRESQCMLCVFIVLIVIILILEIVTAVLAGVFKDELEQTLHDDMMKQVVSAVEPIKPDNNSATSFAWHSMQHEMSCCGADDYNDYRNNTKFSGDNPMPKSCCRLKNDDVEKPEPEDWDECKKEFNSHVQPADAIQLHAIGCYPSLLDWFRQKAGIFIGIACAIALIEILGITFACCVRNELTRHKETV
ncbi:hypothetical protein LSH36_304g00008 [Paralvinella palmiformis]|uniref:Tetraspanin n=1 Tax=Paralvinella palmiformis TaxID=53620 RepID=A0AAD9JHQ2_9ANNE|nr:hypothetical protein LSH36_304g00008 [Paralvinella palmiformis]